MEVPLHRLTAVGEVQDTRAYLTDSQSNISTSLVNTIDVLQGHLRIGGGSKAPTETLIGRFSMEVGSGRLVAQEAYRDVTRTFTGISSRWKSRANFEIRGFFTYPVLTLPADRPALLENEAQLDREYSNQRFWGLWYERSALRRGLRAEGYLYALDERDQPGRRETRDRHLWTVGGRLFRGPSGGAWDIDLESAWQTGRAHATPSPPDVVNLDVKAGYVHASTGYTLGLPWNPRGGIEYDYGSGDSDPSDARWNRFDGLFGNRRIDLAPTSIYGALGRENIDTIGTRLSIVPSARVDVFAVFRWVGLAAAADAFASTGVRDPSGAAGRNAGRQLDARVRISIVPNALRFEGGATVFWRGPFLQNAPNATHEGDTAFLYGDLTYSWHTR